MTDRPTYRDVIRTVAAADDTARYCLQEYAPGRSGVFDRGLKAFVPLGAIRDINTADILGDEE